MKPNEVIECLKKIALYKNAPLTQNEVDALDEAIQCVELFPDFIKYVIDSAGLYICDCKCCDEFRNRKDNLLSKVQENKTW